ncbi:MAG: LysM peptidoglycan-binding domain-containing protein, partial [Ottowia sp.]|nr:LysM peptidoglycan-binding domain-containing protein [Ottowia sp.]
PLGTAAILEASASRLTQAERMRWRYYRVRRGDSLGAIARQFDTSVAQLQRANGISGSLIRVGQKLMIPSGEGWAGGLA